MIPEIGTRVSTAQENMNNIENECESALAGLFKKVTDKQNRLDNYLDQWIPTSKPLFTLPEKFVPNRHTPYMYKQISIPKDRLRIDFSAWENIILKDTLQKIRATKEDKKMGFDVKKTIDVDVYSSDGVCTGHIITEVTVPIYSIPLPTGTIFYKKVYAKKVNDKNNDGFRSAIIRLKSTGEGKCVIDIKSNTNFKCRFHSAAIEEITLFSSTEKVVTGTGRVSKNDRWIDAKIVDHVRRKCLNLDAAEKWVFSSSNANEFKYIYNNLVVPDFYDDSDRVCAPGIHGFLTKSAAEAYRL